jgi:ATP phosphoribosyltransferase regulatory subunit
VLDLSNQQEKELFSLVQAKSFPELDSWIAVNIKNISYGKMLRSLVDLAGDITVLDRARKLLAEAPAEIELALDELQSVASALKASNPELELCFDLSELRGYHYHTGLVFAVYAPGVGQAIGNGGRYDDVGESFGRSRAATGFNMSLQTLVQFDHEEGGLALGVFASTTNDVDQYAIIKKLRLSGDRVVSGFPDQKPNYQELGCDRQLVLVDGKFQVIPI